MSPAVGPVVRAAGALPWRVIGADLQVALVHRPRYDDWSWPKGKLDAAESWPAAAVREVLEETGLRVRLGQPLPGVRYLVTVEGRQAPKVVQYWAAEVVGGSGELTNEVDDVAWLSPDDARSRLTYQRDRLQLAALETAHLQGTLATWPLLLIRHASARARRDWTRADIQRPLDPAGRACADRLVPLLSAYAPHRLLTSPAGRCLNTLRPLAEDRGLGLRTLPELSEEGFAADPDEALRVLRKTLRRGRSTALCTHRPILPTLLGALAELATAPELASALREFGSSGLLKGEALAVHLSGTGAAARVVALERHDPRLTTVR